MILTIVKFSSFIISFNKLHCNCANMQPCILSKLSFCTYWNLVMLILLLVEIYYLRDKLNVHFYEVGLRNSLKKIDVLF